MTHNFSDPVHLPQIPSSDWQGDYQHACDEADARNKEREVCEVSGLPIVGQARSAEELAASRARIAEGMAMVRAHHSPVRSEPRLPAGRTRLQPDGLTGGFLPERTLMRVERLAECLRYEAELKETV